MSHHNSGPRAHALPVADITDMYVFPAPDAPGRMVFVLDTIALAAPDARFSPDLVYRFRVRPVQADPGSRAHFAPGDADTEVTIDLTFSAAAPGAPQRGTCCVSSGAELEFAVDDDAAAGEHLRVFAGPRLDPFFDDASQLQTTITTGKSAFDGAGEQRHAGGNVLAVVVGIDAALLGDGPLYAVVGETVLAGGIPMRWERFGRPELENAVLGMKQYDPVNRDLEIRDLFNAEDAFALGTDYVGAYRARLDANLAFWDGLDDATAWPLGDDGRHPLTDLLLADFLVVDVTKSYAEDTYLEIESAALEGREHRTAGGRSLNDASMPTTYTLLVNGGRGPRITDGVEAAAHPATRTFPYLHPANPTPPVHEAH